MFNIFNQDNENKGYYEERNHQDNFYSKSIKDLNMIDVRYVIQIKIAYTESISY